MPGRNKSKDKKEDRESREKIVNANVFSLLMDDEGSACSSNEISDDNDNNNDNDNDNNGNGQYGSKTSRDLADSLGSSGESKKSKKTKLSKQNKNMKNEDLAKKSSSTRSKYDSGSENDSENDSKNKSNSKSIYVTGTTKSRKTEATNIYRPPIANEQRSYGNDRYDPRKGRYGGNRRNEHYNNVRGEEPCDRRFDTKGHDNRRSGNRGHDTKGYDTKGYDTKESDDKKSDTKGSDDKKSDTKGSEDRRSSNRESDDTRIGNKYHKNSGDTPDNDSDVARINSVIDEGWETSNHKKKRNKPREYDRKKTEMDVLEYHDPDVELPGDKMKLNTNWEVWMHSNSNDDWSLKSYDSIFNIDSIGGMWRFLGCMENLNKDTAQYYVMREGITPIWEDNNNKNGAICSIMIENTNRFNKNFRGDLGVAVFSAICILVMNECCVKNNRDINGLNYSIKNRNILIKLWIKDYNNNKDFVQNLPILFLSSLDELISNMESRNNVLKYQGKSNISVRLNKIEPTY